ncbi:glycosyl transferase family 1, partial [Halobacteriales archaeon QH_3_68_24]
EDLAEVSASGRELIETEYSFKAAKRRYREILGAFSRRTRYSM